jgi:hypothetical protein
MGAAHLRLIRVFAVAFTGRGWQGDENATTREGQHKVTENTS